MICSTLCSLLIAFFIGTILYGRKQQADVDEASAGAEKPPQPETPPEVAPTPDPPT